MLRSHPTVPVRPWEPIPAAPSFPILESKLAPAPTRPGLVARVQLLDWLEASAAAPVVTICAPAGYGKTMLAAEWAKRDPRPFVWLSIDGHDNDPTVLLTYLAVGLDRVEPLDPVVLDTLATRGASITQTVLPRLGAALAGKALPGVVVLDEVHLLHDREGLELALVALVVARTLPESPRWLLTHGRVREAEEELAKIEEVASRSGEPLAEVAEDAAITLVPEQRYGYLYFLRLVFRQYPKRAILGASLMITQSFLYNAIFFTYALVLTSFYGVSATKVPIYGLAFSVGNLAGPLLLAPLFDSLGRKKMISGTYLISGVLLAVSAWLFDNGDLTANSQTFVWVVIFFFASAGASAAYLTVSETWPIEIRSEAIAVFFTIGTIFGAIGPAFYGALIGNGSSRTGLFIGYLVGAAIMILGGIVELLIGINAEGKSLEDVTKPLTAAGD